MNHASETLDRNTTRRALVAMGLAMPLAGCLRSGHEPVPDAAVNLVQPGGIGRIRSWMDGYDGDGDGLAADYARRIRRYNLSRARRFDALVLSGGSQDGAFGAGFLNGWSRSGTRPEFDLVTGVSTGAVMAPFAFLGSGHDPVIEEIYTEYGTRDVLWPNYAAGLAGGPSLMETGRFRKLIERYYTDGLIDAVAREGRKGRVLLIGTTNLEAERGVIWDLTRLAMSDHPDRTGLFRDIILASLSLPGIFPPVPVGVEEGGRRYDELHVDGGIVRHAFLYPPEITLAAVERHLGYRMNKRLFVIRNKPLKPEYRPTEPRATKVIERSVRTLIRVKGDDDLRVIEAIARRDGMAFRLTGIPEGFSTDMKELFDRNYMRLLFETGREMGRSGDAWLGSVP